MQSWKLFQFKIQHTCAFVVKCCLSLFVPVRCGLTYIDKSTRHLLIRAKKHLNLGSSVKSKIKEHISECNLRNKKDTNSLIRVHRFIVIKKCSSDYDCKIHKALLNKKYHQN